MSSIALFYIFLLAAVIAKTPPTYGPYGAKSCDFTEVHIGGFNSGGSQDAYVMWPRAALKENTSLPFLLFAHGMMAGAFEAYWVYEELWNVVCSYGFIIAGPKCCEVMYCQKYYQDLMHTIDVLREQNSKLTPALALVDDWNRIGLYGHSMGGAATVDVSTYAQRENIIAAVALHPSTSMDQNKTESYGIQIPILFFTGNKDHIVPSREVLESFNADPVTPKIYAELEGADHLEPTMMGRNYEDPYVAVYFDCWLKRNDTACNNYFYDSMSPDYICNGGLATSKCMINGTKTLYFNN